MEKLGLVLGLIALLGAGVYLYSEESTGVTKDVNAIDDEVVTLYLEWKKKFNKKYNTPDQDWYRLTVFNDNYAAIKEFYEGPEQTYTLDINVFMDLTAEEFAETFLGTKVPETIVGEAYTRKNKAVPNTIDWRERGALNSVRNQGACGSCWAFSAVGALEAAHFVQGKGLPAVSEQELVDCSTDYGNAGCGGGWMDNAFQYVIDHGITNLSDYAYVARDQTCQRQNNDFTLTGFQTIRTCEDLEAAAVERPVSVAVDAGRWQFYSGGVFNNCGTRLNHGVVLVGFHDDHWIIRNSWGQSWGEQGHIKLARGNTCGICSHASFPIA